MRIPSSTKERIEIGIFKFFKQFSRIWRNGERYSTNKIGERAEPWPTPMLTSKKGKVKLFQK